MAWGQGELVATPAAMARVAASIANGGVLVQNRYIMKVGDTMLPSRPGIAVAKDPQYAALMTTYMKEQSAPKVAKLGIAVAGKTGTPQRVFHNKHMTDGWYVFFAPKANGDGYMVTCVRVEDTKGSSIAVQLAGAVVVPILREAGYIKGFDAVATADFGADTLSTDTAAVRVPEQENLPTPTAPKPVQKPKVANEATKPEEAVDTAQ
jgi:cell division protein FtsI/penicillin-binding protein 2